MGKHEYENIAPQFDIAIIGGGMVGMALACSLGISFFCPQFTDLSTRFWSFSVLGNQNS